MDLSFTHVFDNISHATCLGTYSPKYYKGTTEWGLRMKLTYDKSVCMFEVYLLGGRRTSVANNVNFTIISDFVSTIKSQDSLIISVKQEKSHMFSCNILFPCEACLIKMPLDKIKPLLVSDKLIVCVNVHIKKIRRFGCGLGDKLKIYKFCSPLFLNHDVIVHVEHGKFFCHTQLLSFVSPYFAQLIKKAQDNRNEDLGGIPSIFLENVDYDAVKDYLAIIYHFNLEISKENLENLLELADKFETRILFSLCEEYLLKEIKVRSYPLPIEKIVVLSWKYDLDRLKFDILECCNSADYFKRFCMQSEYHILSESKKLSICEILFENINFCKVV